MSAIIEQAERMRQEAIALLVAERDAIDQKLSLMGYAGEPMAKSTGKKKQAKPEPNGQAEPTESPGQRPLQ